MDSFTPATTTPAAGIKKLQHFTCLSSELGSPGGAGGPPAGSGIVPASTAASTALCSAAGEAAAANSSRVSAPEASWATVFERVVAATRIAFCSNSTVGVPWEATTPFMAASARLTACKRKWVLIYFN